MKIDIKKNDLSSKEFHFDVFSHAKECSTLVTYQMLITRRILIANRYRQRLTLKKMSE